MIEETQSGLFVVRCETGPVKKEEEKKKYYFVRCGWRNRVTGDSGIYTETSFPSLWEDEHGINDFMWTDGNYGCGCNRGLYFAKEEPGDCNDFWEIEWMEAIDRQGRLVSERKPWKDGEWMEICEQIND